MGRFSFIYVKECVDCGRSFDPPEGGVAAAQLYCFKCKMRSINVNWVGGGGYGRQAFHDNTVGEVQRRTVADAARAGVAAEPVPQRAVLV